LNILTIDIEEWFHILEYPPVKFEHQWLSFPNRLEQNTNRILDLLAGRQQPATFFILGWVAKKHPYVVKKITRIRKLSGIGLHSSNHLLLYESSPAQFRNDIREGNKMLEDITGLPIRYYRAPGFSLFESTRWAFQILAEEGFEADSSVFPAPRLHGGMLTFPYNQPCIIDAGNGLFLKEFPINTISVLGHPLVFSGGGYFRFWPYPLIKTWTRKSDYIMSYFHPRDFDPTQPRLPGLSPLRHFMTYSGLQHTQSKLNQWLNDFDFIDLDTAIKKVDWSNAPIYKV